MSDKQPEKHPAHESLEHNMREFRTNGYDAQIKPVNDSEMSSEYKTLLTDRQADEKLIRELLNILMISEPICWRNENIVSRHQQAIARAQTRLGGEPVKDPEVWRDM